MKNPVKRARKIVTAVKRKTKELKGSKLFEGETHGIVWVPGSGPERTNFMGPGTNIIERLRRGDKGKTPIDEISKLHDIEYTLASGLAKDEKEHAQMGRAADERMMYAGWTAFVNGRESLFNTVQGAGLIKAKTLLEDWGILSRTKFLSPRTFKYKLESEHRDATEYELLMRARNAMINEGVNADKYEAKRLETNESLFSV